MNYWLTGPACDNILLNLHVPFFFFEVCFLVYVIGWYILVKYILERPMLKQEYFTIGMRVGKMWSRKATLFSCESLDIVVVPQSLLMESLLLNFWSVFSGCFNFLANSYLLNLLDLVVFLNKTMFSGYER